MARPASARRASSTAGLYCECHVVKSVRPARRGEALEIGEFAQGGGGRFLEEDVLAGRESGAGDRVARLRGRADGDRVEVVQTQHLLPILEGMRHPVDGDAALARDRDEREGGVGPDHGQVLILGDLAEADHPELIRLHGNPNRYLLGVAGWRTLGGRGSFPLWL